MSGYIVKAVHAVTREILDEKPEFSEGSAYGRAASWHLKYREANVYVNNKLFLGYEGNYETDIEWRRPDGP